MEREHLDTFRGMTRVDFERREIDASAWVDSLPEWYRDPCRAIVRHWSEMMGLSANEPDVYLRNIASNAQALTPQGTSVRRARGIVEWCHPADRREDPPQIGICWLGGFGGANGTWLCWTPLWDYPPNSGARWNQEMSPLTPVGGAAAEIVEYVRRRVQED